MTKFCRWLCIRLLSRSCLRKAPDFTEGRKSYIVFDRWNMHLRLIGQEPGSSYGSPGRKVMVLMGELIQYAPGRTVLRTAGAFFESTGVLLVKPGPGVSWGWYLQVGE